MSDRFDERVEGAVGQIAETARELLDEDEGALGRTLAQGVERFETLIGSTFNKGSKQSVVAVFEEVLRDAHRSRATICVGSWPLTVTTARSASSRSR